MLFVVGKRSSVVLWERIQIQTTDCYYMKMESQGADLYQSTSPDLLELLGPTLIIIHTDKTQSLKSLQTQEWLKGKKYIGLFFTGMC